MPLRVCLTLYILFVINVIVGLFSDIVDSKLKCRGADAYVD